MVKMNEEQFLKHHPSLKGLCLYDDGLPPLGKKEDHWTGWWIRLDKVHETQIDKSKVKEVIEKQISAMHKNQDSCTGYLRDIKKELGLE